MTAFTDPAPIGNAFGPGRDAVICTDCGALVLVPRAGEPDWADLHSTRHADADRAADVVAAARPLGRKPKS